MVDSTNNYCLNFDLYTGDKSCENVTEFGKVHDLVFRLLQPYLGKGHHVYMDNWYSSPVIFHNLTLVDTGATGTVRSNRVGLPNGFSKIKVTEKGEKRVFTKDNLQVMRIMDRKAVNIMSNIFSATDLNTGKKHWKSKEDILKPQMMVMYNKYMGGVDANDQLLQYSAFDRQNVKWWKKCAFRLLNLAMVNSYILYLRVFETKTSKKNKAFTRRF